MLLITDEESGVGALLEKSRIHGVLRGQNSDFCQLRYVLNDEKVEVGERLFTSGEDKVFPKGFTVGKVSAVEAGGDFKRITVEPAVKLNRIEDVLIVIQGRELALPGPAAPAVATAPAPEPPPAEAAPPASAPAATERPGIQHGVRPETDADKIRETYRQKTLAANPPVAKQAATPQKPPQRP